MMKKREKLGTAPLLLWLHFCSAPQMFTCSPQRHFTFSVNILHLAVHWRGGLNTFVPYTWSSLSTQLLACSQLDQTSNWVLLFLCCGEAKELQLKDLICEMFSCSLSNTHTFSLTIPSSLPLSLHLFGLWKPFAVWVKQEEEELSFQTESSVAFQNIYIEIIINNGEHMTMDIADTTLKRCVFSIPAVVFKPKTLEPRGGAPHSKPREKTPLPWYSDCAIYYIWRMFNQHSWLFSQSFFRFSKGNIIYRYYIIWYICI